MPWSSADAHRHTHKADTASKQRQWAHVANNALARGLSEGAAVREANSAVGHNHGHHSPRKSQTRLGRM